MVLVEITGCSAVWLARLVRDQEVAGSNPASPISPNFFVEHVLSVPPDGQECGLKALEIQYMYWISDRLCPCLRFGRTFVANLTELPS